MPSPVVNQRIHNETLSHHSVSEVLAAVGRAAQELEALSQSPAQPSCSLEDCGHTTLEKMKLLTALFKHGNSGNSLAVRWLGLGAFTAMPVVSVPGQGTKVQQTRQWGQKKKKKEIWLRRHGASARVTVTLKVIIRKTKAVETLINAKYYSEF